MKKQITIVILEDNSIINFKDYTPFIKIGNTSNRIGGVIEQHNKKESFENQVLHHINEDVFRKYAKIHYDLEEYEEPEEKTIYEFSDKEILNELTRRSLIGNINHSVISSEFLVRFSKIAAKENIIKIDELLTELEIKIGL